MHRLDTTITTAVVAIRADGGIDLYNSIGRVATAAKVSRCWTTTNDSRWLHCSVDMQLCRFGCRGALHSEDANRCGVWKLAAQLVAAALRSLLEYCSLQRCCCRS